MSETKDECALRLLREHGGDKMDPVFGLDLVQLSEGKLKRGTVYVVLARLEDQGLVKREKFYRSAGPPRHAFSLVNPPKPPDTDTVDANRWDSYVDEDGPVLRGRPGGSFLEPLTKRRYPRLAEEGAELVTVSDSEPEEDPKP